MPPSVQVCVSKNSELVVVFKNSGHVENKLWMFFPFLGRLARVLLCQQYASQPRHRFTTILTMVALALSEI